MKKIDKSELIKLLMNSDYEIFYKIRDDYQPILDWAYKQLEQDIDDENHSVACLASLGPKDYVEIRDFIEKIIGRYLTPQDKVEWGGSHICKLGNKFEHCQIDEWNLEEEVVKLYMYLEEPYWLDFVMFVDLNWELRRDFFTNVKEPFHYIYNLWKQYPDYHDFVSVYRKHK